MTKVKIKAEFDVSEMDDQRIKQAINQKFADKIIESPSVPRIGEWVDFLELFEHYNLSEEELKWLTAREHKYRIQNVNKCDGFIEAVLDMDKVWPEEA